MKYKSIIKTIFTVFKEHYDNKKCTITTKSPNVVKNINSSDSLWFYFSISTGTRKKDFVNGHFNIEINCDDSLTVYSYFPTLYSIDSGRTFVNPKCEFTCFSTKVQKSALREEIINILYNFDCIIETSIYREKIFNEHHAIIVEDGIIRRKIAEKVDVYRYGNNIMVVLHDINSGNTGKTTHWYNMYNENYHNLIERNSCDNLSFIKKLKLIQVEH